MFTDLYIPERFGTCTKGKSRGFTYTQNNTENYDEKYKEIIAEYKHTLYPFGVSLLSKDSTKVMGFVIDIDDHKSTPMTMEEVADLIEKVREICSPIELGAEATQANNGVHLWCLFNQPVQKELFFKFTDFIHARLDTDVEIFPSAKKEPFWIRLPGLHKDYMSWSYDMETREELKLIDDVENFMDRYTCNIEVFEEYIQENKVTTFSLEKSRKGVRKRKKQEGSSIRPEILSKFVTGIQDEHFEAIWLFATDGQQCPPDNEQICCPFHGDSEPSSRVYFDEKQHRRVFVCYSDNCPFNSHPSSITIGHDGFDILSWKVLGTFDKNKENIQTIMEFFSEQIMSSYIAPYLMPKGKILTVNYIKLTEALSRYMYQPGQGAGDIEIRKGSDHILYFYNSGTKMWEPAHTQSEEISKIHMTVKDILLRLVGTCGLYQLNAHGINKLLQDIRHYIYLQKAFTREYLEREVIPCKNGLLDIKKLLNDDWENALTPYKKDNYITKTIAASYDPKAENLQFRAFIERILPNDAIKGVVMEYLATCLSPSIEPQKCQIWIGEGKNGKGTLCNIMEKLFGDVYLSFGLHDLAHPFRASMLDQSFLTIDPDSIMSSIDQKTIASLKKVTGGDTIIGEQKFKDAFTFKYQGGFVVCTNSIPRLGDANYALFRRLLIVPFQETIEGGNTVDKYWKTVIEAEGGLSGILNELLRALMTYIRRGKKFENIEECQLLIKEFAEESDPIMSYVSSVFETNMNISHNERLNGLSDVAPRLTHEELVQGVTSEQLYEDFVLFSKKAGSFDSLKRLQLGLPKFRKNFLKRAGNTVYSKYISSKRLNSGKVYMLNTIKARLEGVQVDE